MRSMYRAGTPEPLAMPTPELLLLVTNGYVPWSTSSSAPWAPSNSSRLPLSAAVSSSSVVSQTYGRSRSA